MPIQDLGETEVIPCGHCENRTRMTIRGVADRVYEQNHSSIFWEEGDRIQVLECPVCSGWTVRQLFIHTGREPDIGVVKSETLHPVEAGLPSSLPDQISSAYRAAIKVKRIDSNAFGVLLGRVIEMVAIEQEAEGSTLFERLESLSKKGAIPKRIVDVGHNLRKLRNVGAHPGLGELTPEEVPVLDKLCRAILEYVYSLPALVSDADQCIDKIKSG